YYMGSALAEMLRGQGKQVTLVTPGADVSAWTFYTLEQRKIRAALMKAGIGMETSKVLHAVEGDEAELT
ncbi:hypothetical protein, partial [Citrobacter freundii]|uniref:hypothetical protein n=1 Tax=Citrobacter freundii TaxID=546 RepID=UPI0019534AA5